MQTVVDSPPGVRPSAVLGMTAPRAPVWRGLGVRFDQGPVTAREAITRAGLDFGFDKVPIYSLYPAYTEDGTPIYGPDGAQRLMRMEHPTQRHLIRQAFGGNPPEIVGVVHKNFPALDNMTVAGMVEDVSVEWPVETAGALGNGERLFLVLNAGESVVAGETLTDYFVLYDPRGNHRAMNIFFAPVETVCQNTLRLHLGDMTLDVRINHVAGTYERDARFAVELFGRMGGIKSKAYKAFNRLAETPTNAEHDARIAALISPDPTYPKSLQLLEVAVETGVDVADLILRAREDQAQYEQDMVRAAEKRSALRLLMQEYDDTRSAPGTLWRSYRAAVEMQDYWPGFKQGDRTTAFVGDRARAKEQVFEYALRAANLA